MTKSFYTDIQIPIKRCASCKGTGDLSTIHDDKPIGMLFSNLGRKTIQSNRSEQNMKLSLVFILLALLSLGMVLSAPVCCQNCGGNSISVLEDEEQGDEDVDTLTNGDCRNRFVCKIDCRYVLPSNSPQNELSRTRFLEFNGRELYEMEVYNGACLGTRFRKNDEYDNLINKYFSQLISYQLVGRTNLFGGRVLKWLHADQNGNFIHRSDVQDAWIDRQMLEMGLGKKAIPAYNNIVCAFKLWNEFMRSIRDFCQSKPVTPMMISDEMTRIWTVLGIDSRMRNCGIFGGLKTVHNQVIHGLRVELVASLSKQYATPGNSVGGMYCNCFSVYHYIRVVRGGIGEAVNWMNAMYRQCKSPQ